jgi:hypothetical protein
MNRGFKNVPCSVNKYLTLTKDITSEMLRAAADKMDSNDIKSFKFPYYYGTTCMEFRPETVAEENARIKKEQEAKIAEFKRIEKKKKDLITQAKKLGLILTEERCINEQ